MSDDFIEKLRREAVEKAKQAKVPEPWVIERQKEDEQNKRNRALAIQYFQESGCQAHCEKLAAFLNSQDQFPKAEASLIDLSYPGQYQIRFKWTAKVYVRESRYNKSLSWREIWFGIEVKPDGSIAFKDMDYSTYSTVTVPLNVWRTNKQKVDSAFEDAYRRATNTNYYSKNQFDD